MPWIKRNLFFVIGLAVGLVLAGFCGFLLYKDLADNTAVNDEFQQNVSQYNTLQSTPPYPSDDNIQMAKQDQQSAEQFLTEMRKAFVPFPPVPAVDERGFKTYLEDTVYELRAAATNASVQLPSDFAFAFTDQQNKLNYLATDIPLWMQQLAEIKAICNILFEAKVNALDSLQRVRVSDTDSGSAADCLATGPTTNESQIATPYMISFRGFGREISSVLNGFSHAGNCFIVESVSVAPAPEDANTPSFSAAPTAEPAEAPPRPVGLPPPGVDAREWFRQQRFGAVPAPTPTPRPQSYSTAPVTVLTEHPLRVTVLVEVIKFKAGN